MTSSPHLKQSLGMSLVVVIVIANVIGSGVYKKVAPMAAELHSPGWVLTAWVLGGIISLFGALCNAEVAGLLADTGGEYAYYQKIYNKKTAYIFGWSMFAVIQTAAISSLAYIFSQSINSIEHLPPVLESWSEVNLFEVFYPFKDFNVKFLAIISILILTWINSKGLKGGARLSSFLLALVIIGILLIIIFGLSSPHSNLSGVFSTASSTGQPVTFSAIFVSMLAAFWAYQGWASIGFIGGEVKNAKKNIPLGLAGGLFIIIGIYLLVNMTYLSLLSIPELESIYKTQNSIAAVEAVKVFWGEDGSFFIAALIAVTTLGCNHATIYSSCRTFYAMAKEGLFFKKAATLNKSSVPGGSMWIQGIWASILVLSGTFDQLTDMVIFSIFIFYGLTTMGVFILRKRMPDAPRPYKVWGYPVVPIIVILFCAALFINTIIERPREAGIGMALMLTGVPFYFWFIRENSKVKSKN
ncbi:MAG TPA: amino acid permease [Chitinophagaceae bacterium]|nr:amino acid permease [Chitinophagaceae bacterium]